MQRIRVLIVDDSTVVRRMLSDILSAEPDMEVVGTAANASIARSKVTQVAPDVITLDIEMPGTNGLDFLAELRAAHPDVPVIMCSSLTQRAAATTLDALARGAADYVTKPEGAATVELASRQVRDQLVPKIRAVGRWRQPRILTPSLPSPTPSDGRPLTVLPVLAHGKVEVLAVGASTGGPNALADMFKHLPADFPVPVVLVQHMPPVFTRMLAERLTAAGPLKFKEAENGDVLKPGLVLVAPGDHHMRVVKDTGRVTVRLNQDAPENSCRPAVDVLFRSVVDVFGGKTLGVVLTGMGQDGLRGCESIRSVGGQVVVQDQKTSVVWGMPGFVAKAGLANAVLPLPEVPWDVLRRVRLAGGMLPKEREHVRTHH